MFSQLLVYKYMYMYITGTNLLTTLTGNHTYASVKGREEYSFLKACFKPVWEEVEEVIANPVIDMSTTCTLCSVLTTR